MIFLTYVFKAPILLPIFSLLPLDAHPLLSGLIYIVFDLLGAKALLDISASGASTVSRLYTTPRKDIKWDSVSIASGYAVCAPPKSC